MEQENKKRWISPNDLIAIKKPKRSRSASFKTSCLHEPLCSTADDTEIGFGLEQSKIQSMQKIGGNEKKNDWELKSKVRITSCQDFVWLDSSKPFYQSKALTKLDTEDQDPLSLFHQSRLVWMHPFYPFLDVFPRMGPKIPTGQQESLNLSEQQQSLVKEHWSSSFHSVFEQLRNDCCPYFYLCANSLTVLFVARCQVPPHGFALLTPTTAGFRHAMRRQGIEFSLPLCTDKDSTVLEETESAGNWLKDIVATDISLIPAAESSSLPTNSLVIVKGTHFLALTNFILNCKSLIASEGLFAGIPPTLLAPSSFLGSTVIPLKIKRSLVQEASRGSATLVNKHCLEITGPILPTNIQKLRNTLEQLQTSYTMHSHPVGSTTSFNQYLNGTVAQ